MKRITWWPQLWLGINFNWGVLIGYYSLREPHVNLTVITVLPGMYILDDSIRYNLWFPRH